MSAVLVTWLSGDHSVFLCTILAIGVSIYLVTCEVVFHTWLLYLFRVMMQLISLQCCLCTTKCRSWWQYCEMWASNRVKVEILWLYPAILFARAGLFGHLSSMHIYVCAKLGQMYEWHRKHRAQTAQTSHVWWGGMSAKSLNFNISIPFLFGDGTSVGSVLTVRASLARLPSSVSFFSPSWGGLAGMAQRS